MNIVRAEFHRLSELPTSALFGAMGVYVLWTKDAWARPSYIGEGNLLSRINDHVDSWLGRDGDGCAAILGYTTERPSKFDAEVVEGTLLEAAQLLNRLPPRNKQRARMRAQWSRAKQGHNTIRVKISGWHPLRWNARLEEAAVFHWRHFEDREYQGWYLDDDFPVALALAVTSPSDAATSSASSSPARRDSGRASHIRKKKKSWPNPRAR